MGESGRLREATATEIDSWFNVSGDSHYRTKRVEVYGVCLRRVDYKENTMASEALLAHSAYPLQIKIFGRSRRVAAEATSGTGSGKNRPSPGTDDDSRPGKNRPSHGPAGARPGARRRPPAKESAATSGAAENTL